MSVGASLKDSSVLNGTLCQGQTDTADLFSLAPPRGLYFGLFQSWMNNDTNNHFPVWMSCNQFSVPERSHLQPIFRSIFSSHIHTHTPGAAGGAQSCSAQCSAGTSCLSDCTLSFCLVIAHCLSVSAAPTCEHETDPLSDLLSLHLGLCG